jgi:hypothetical protein
MATYGIAPQAGVEPVLHRGFDREAELALEPHDRFGVPVGLGEIACEEPAGRVVDHIRPGEQRELAAIEPTVAEAPAATSRESTARYLHRWRAHGKPISTDWARSDVAVQLGGAEWLGVEPLGRAGERGQMHTFEQGHG